MKTYILCAILATTQLEAATKWQHAGVKVESDEADSRIGCTRENMAFVAAGQEISFIYSKLGVELTGAGDLVERRFCRIRMPFEIEAGTNVTHIDETFTYGYEKTPHSSGDISIHTDFLGTISNKNINIPRSQTETSEPYLTYHHSKSVGAGCHHVKKEGFYKVQIRTAGRRANLDESIVLQIDGQDLKWHAKTKEMACTRARD